MGSARQECCALIAGLGVDTRRVFGIMVIMLNLHVTNRYAMLYLKYQILAFVCLLTCIANAQNMDPTTVIFFWDAHYKTPTSLIFKNRILKDDSIVIGKICMNSVLIYQGSSDGKYAVRNDKKHSILLKDDSLQFVRITHRMGWFHARFSLEEITKDEFVRLYNKKNWLRKEMLDLGYENIGQSVK